MPLVVDELGSYFDKITLAMELSFHQLKGHLSNTVETIPNNLTNELQTVELKDTGNSLPYYLMELHESLRNHFENLYINQVLSTLNNLDTMTRLEQQEFINSRFKAILSDFSDHAITLLFFEQFNSVTIGDWIRKIERLFGDTTGKLERATQEFRINLTAVSNKHRKLLVDLNNLEALWTLNPVGAFIASCNSLLQEQKDLSAKISTFRIPVTEKSISSTTIDDYLNKVNYKDVLTSMYSFPTKQDVVFNEGTFRSSPIPIAPKTKYVYFVALFRQKAPTFTSITGINVYVEELYPDKFHLGSVQFAANKLSVGSFSTKPIAVPDRPRKEITVNIEFVPVTANIQFFQLSIQMICLHEDVTS